eukprot:TRINITY_DN13458_c0_g1_i1.p1 TRINITY_DN13458_c0_g1~~TRINITY_DN13458_c0_g1_i1.p1  ORF type:complete len:297 (-),score=63.99 TRINITY_DN13458_c0_g1_i1:9-899(-)
MDFFNKFKEKVNDISNNAQLEAEYMKRHQFNNFTHTDETQEIIYTYKMLNDEMNHVARVIAYLEKGYRQVMEEHAALADGFEMFLDIPMQHPELKRVYKYQIDKYRVLHREGIKRVSALSEVSHDWKEIADLLDTLRNRLASMNKANSDHMFWKNKGLLAEETAAEMRYIEEVNQFKRCVKDLNTKRLQSVPDIINQLAEMDKNYFKACSIEARECEHNLLNVEIIHGEMRAASISTNPDFLLHSRFEEDVKKMCISSPVRATAQFSFTAETEEELSFKEGDILTIKSQTVSYLTL